MRERKEKTWMNGWMDEWMRSYWTGWPKHLHWFVGYTAFRRLFSFTRTQLLQNSLGQCVSHLSFGNGSSRSMYWMKVPGVKWANLARLSISPWSIPQNVVCWICGIWGTPISCRISWVCALVKDIGFSFRYSLVRYLLLINQISTTDSLSSIKFKYNKIQQNNKKKF